MFRERCCLRCWIHVADCSETNLLIKNTIVRGVMKRASLGETPRVLFVGAAWMRRIRRRTLLGLIASPSVAKLLMMLVKKHSSPR